MRILVAAATALILLVGGATACSSDEHTPQTIEIVVPAGTQDRVTRGEDVDVMPARLELRVGDTLSIRNNDSVGQAVGPYYVKAGEHMRLTFGTAGRFEGYCPLSEGDRYELVVKD
jgi:plastocyanin